MLEEIFNLKTTKEWCDFENFYERPTFLEQINFFRFEDIHTNILASLLKSDNIYGLGNYPIKMLLNLIMSKELKYADKLNMFDNYSITNVSVETQKVFKSGRPDLFITFSLNDNNKKYAILIENKLYYEEHDNQCDSYYQEIEKMEEYSDYEKIYIFLSLDNSIKISSDEYIRLNYREYVEKILEPCSFRENHNLPLSIKEYIRSFKCLYSVLSKPSLIPILREGKILSQEVWEKNKELLLKILKDKASKIYETKLLLILYINLYRMNLDNDLNTLIENRIVNNYSNSLIVCSILEKIINRYSITSIDELKPLDISKTGYKVVLTKKERSTYPRGSEYKLRDEPLKLKNGEELYYHPIVTQRELDNFINSVIEKYPELSKELELF